MKYSSQRERILSVVRECSDHPTADVVYARLRPEMPNLSLGTVYRNLNRLSEIGEIRKIPLPEGGNRFDWHLKPHYHLICSQCGEVTDCPAGALEPLLTKVQADTGFALEVGQLILYGLCSGCQKKAKDKYSQHT